MVKSVNMESIAPDVKIPLKNTLVFMYIHNIIAFLYRLKMMPHSSSYFFLQM